MKYWRITGIYVLILLLSTVKVHTQNSLVNTEAVQNIVLILLVIVLILAIGLSIILFRNINSRRNYTLKLENQNKQIKEYQENLLIHQEFLEDLVKKRTKELETAMEKVERTDKLKTQFLLNLSHEVRTPMNAILGFTKMLAQSDINEKERNEAINYILNNSNSLLQLIDNVVEYSRLETGHMDLNFTKHNLFDIIDEVVNEHQNHDKIKSRKVLMKFIVKKKKEEFNGIMDVNKLKKICYNIIDNAVKYTDYGFLHITIDKINYNDSTTLSFIVQDSGIGIDEEALPNIYNMFGKIERSQEKLFRGVGLGLPVSKKLVELLGGEIHVESQINKGTTFTVYLPILKDSEPIIKPPTGNTESLYWENKTILIAEDDDANYYLTKRMLKPTQVNILRASDGEDSVDKIKSEAVNLVLMDIKMPKMNGFEATKEIKKVKPQVPIVVQTAYVDSDYEAMFSKMDVDEVLIKPFESEMLIKTINKYIK